MNQENPFGPPNPYAPPQNPYAPPANVPNYGPSYTPPPQPNLPASQGKRLANFFIDAIITNIISTPVAVVIGVAYALGRSNPGTPLAPDEDIMIRIVGFFVGLIISTLYYVLTEGLFQRSLAKFITGTKVVTTDGGKPTMGQILGRSLARFIPFEPFSFLGGKNPTGWHDTMSGTLVVEAK